MQHVSANIVGDTDRWLRNNLDRRGAGPVTAPIQLLYVHDPLCGWCYAMQPALNAVRAQLGDLSIQTYNIGLWVGSGYRLIAQGFREHLQQGVPQVEQLSGVRFGAAFHTNILDNDDYVYESGTVGLADQCIKRLAPSRHLDFIHDCQSAFFSEGQSANDIATFLRIARRHGIPQRRFADVFYATETRERMRAEMKEAAALCQRAGSHSAPTFLLKSATQLVAVNHHEARAPARFVQAIEQACRTLQV